VDADDILALMADILADDEMQHLTVKDVRLFINHLQPFTDFNEEGEAEGEEDLNRFIL